MYPLWDIVIAPVLEASKARRVVEIGALRGETTTLLLELLGPKSEVDVIDPVPQFDPTEHERQFAGRYRFHRAPSHEAIPLLGPVDVALIDGDHNWYTVHRELELLAETARSGGARLPLLILHDVLWPYGRRDLYYDPERIPEEHRQPYAHRGMAPGRSELLDVGGVNPTLANALREGGAKNGVMTALEDFAGEYDRPLRRVVIPIYFGLAVVAEEAALEENPALAAAFDRLEGPEARGELLELSESLRIRSVRNEHDAAFGAEARRLRGARRYLSLLKDALLGVHQLDNELRVQYLMRCLKEGEEPDPVVIASPGEHLGSLRRLLETGRATGSVRAEAVTTTFPYTAMGRRRLDHLETVLDSVREEAVAGDFVEAGVGRGGGAIFARGYNEALGMGARNVWLADRFLADPDGSQRGLTADLNSVRDGFERFEVFDGRVKFLQGEPAETLADAAIERIAVLRIDSARLESVAGVLDAAYERVAIGGFVVIDGVSEARRRREVDVWREQHGIPEALTRVDDHAIVWRKLQDVSLASAGEGPRKRAHPPLLQPVRGSQRDLSVIVVMYGMRRVAQRTLHSLSRAYQQGIEDLDYEVIVVENGSPPGTAIDAETVASFGEEFTLLDLGESATPSPVHALNRGIEESTGRTLALMIDGAHVLTPGVLRYGMMGTRMYAPAVVATQQWFVGPGQQDEAIGQGYDADYEDRLFHRVAWPADGYRLFEIGHFIGVRDWLDGLWESNCLFCPRESLEQIGAMDESFSMQGGGFSNLDLYERLSTDSKTNLVTILGEGSFHQIHGGTTTNQSDAEARKQEIDRYRRHYEELRGKQFGFRRNMHFVGSMTEQARRTRARRMGARMFIETAQEIAEDKRPTRPLPLPAELQSEFIEAYWRSFGWAETKWLGAEVARSPADLVTLQERIAEAEPTTLIEIRTEGPELAPFLASMCELTTAERVLTIGANDPPAAVANSRIERLVADPLSDEARNAAIEAAGNPPRAFVVIGLAPDRWLREAFAIYSPLVHPGSYVVLENTIMNGYPVWPGMGPGPTEAATQIPRHHPEFERDPRLMSAPLSFNPGGYLRRRTD